MKDARLKDTRWRVLKYIIEYKQSHDGSDPSYQEIREQLGISSTSVVSYHVGTLREEGLLPLNGVYQAPIDTVLLVKKQLDAFA